eukprot:GHRQ01005381.1.p1 GENE.GHRQ01005381.1~~GHRQ01005381.1.p1  ORF type:complete len:266 (+),score=68.40 GHRQ01005381.1:371-1168(+)
MGSLHAEIGIMVAILVGAWAVKVAAVAVYLYFHRRRLGRLAATGQSLPAACHCQKPTPQPVITSLPVIHYADAVQQLKSAGRRAEQGSSKVGAAAAAAAAETTPPRHDQQQQLDIESQLDQQQSSAASAVQEHQADDLRRSSASSVSAAAAGDVGQSSSTSKPQPSSTEAECCSICFGEYDAADVEVKQLPCRHYFHPDCIDAWLARDNTCPLCKSLVWVPDDAAGLAAVDVAGQQQQQQHGQGHRHLLRVIVIGGPLPRWQQVQ